MVARLFTKFRVKYLECLLLTRTSRKTVFLINESEQKSALEGEKKELSVQMALSTYIFRLKWFNMLHG